MPSEDAILDLLRRWAEAEEANDAGSTDAVLADGFAGVGPLGFVLDRGQWLERFENGMRNRSFRIEDPVVHEHGASAFVVAVTESESSWKGSDRSGRLRATITAVRSADGWRIAGIHYGPLQAPPVQS